MPTCVARMGVAGRAKARAEFDERDVVRTVLDTYRDVARRKGLTLFAGSRPASLRW